MRSMASRRPSRATVMVWPLAWIMFSPSVMIATWPFQNTRSPRRSCEKSAPASTGVPSAASCMSESRSTSRPAMRIGKLDEPGAVDAEGAGAAPEIGRVDEPLGDRDIVVGSGPDRREMLGDQRLARGQQRIARAARLGMAGDCHPRADGKCAGARELHVRAGIDEGARGHDEVGCLIAAWREIASRDIADITVALGLEPGKALGLLEDQDIVAVQQLRVEPGVRPRRLADVGDRRGNARRASGDEALGGDFALQAGVGKIGAESVKAAVAGGQIGSSMALAMIASPKRST